jgi:uncharacterized protein
VTAPAVQACAEGVLVFVRVTPKAQRDVISGLVLRGGRQRLIVRVRALPADNAANDAVAALIAKTFRCKPSSAGIAAGHKDRDKTVLIAGGDVHAISACVGEVLGDGGVD